MLRRHAILRHHPVALTISVDPRHIDGYVGKNIPVWQLAESLTGQLARLLPSGNLMRTGVQWLIQESIPFVIPGHLYARPTAVAELPKYRALVDLVENRTDYTASQWYRSMCATIERGGTACHKRRTMQTVEELNAFFEDYLLVLINTMAESGYAFSSLDDVGYVTIGAEGEIHKANAGEHRFMAAKILGARPIPVRVTGVHAAWAQAHRRSGIGGSSWLWRALREVEQAYQ